MPQRTTEVTTMDGADLAQQLLTRLQTSFDEADKDGTGALSYCELYHVLTANGFKGTEEDAKTLFKRLDSNADEQLSRGEFSLAVKQIPRMTVKEYVLRKAFLQLDKDKSGTLTRAEIEAASSKEAGIDIADSKVQQLLTALEKDSKDNVIDYEEFLRVLGMEETATVMFQVFSQLDADNSGYLTKEEVKAALSSHSELKLSVTKIFDLLMALGKEADKQLDYKEFVQAYLKR